MSFKRFYLAHNSKTFLVLIIYVVFSPNWFVRFKGSLQPKKFLFRKCNIGPLYQDLQNIFSQKIFFPWVFSFPGSKLHIFFHNCHILKPELLLHKTTTVQFVNSCGFKKQQFWFKDVTVVEKEEQFWFRKAKNSRKKDFWEEIN